MRTNFRVPDLGVCDPSPDSVYLPSCRVVVEVLSPEDETYANFGFCAAHGVDEILVADPDARTVQCWVLGANATYPLADRSIVLGFAGAGLAVLWP